MNKVIAAAHLAGKNLTAEEIAKELATKPRAVREALHLAGLKLSGKPFGWRPLTVHLSGEQVEGLRKVAAQQGIGGVDPHTLVLEQAGRRLGADPALLKGILDPTMRTLIVPEDALQPLRAEAKRRGITPAALATILLETIGRDNLAKAIIDA